MVVIVVSGAAYERFLELSERSLLATSLFHPRAGHHRVIPLHTFRLFSIPAISKHLDKVVKGEITIRPVSTKLSVWAIVLTNVPHRTANSTNIASLSFLIRVDYRDHRRGLSMNGHPVSNIRRLAMSFP